MSTRHFSHQVAVPFPVTHRQVALSAKSNSKKSWRATAPCPRQLSRARCRMRPATITRPRSRRWSLRSAWSSSPKWRTTIAAGFWSPVYKTRSAGSRAKVTVNDRAIARDHGNDRIGHVGDRIRVSANITTVNAITAITIAIIIGNDRDRVSAIIAVKRSITIKIATSIGNRSLDENDLRETIAIAAIGIRNVNDLGIEFDQEVLLQKLLFLFWKPPDFLLKYCIRNTKYRTEFVPHLIMYYLKVERSVFIYNPYTPIFSQIR